MKRILPLVLLLLSSSLFAASVFAASRPPNLIIILLDDLGVHDAGFLGNDFIETPAMDQLARDGVVFTHAYANAPNCAPSRAAIISGQAAPRTGVYTMGSGDLGDPSLRKVLTPRNNVFLPERVYTLAELLRDRGYATAHIGKWNLGNGPLREPQGQGFQLNIGGHRGGVGHSYYAPYAAELPGLQNSPDGEYLTDRLNREALAFARDHRQQPFFLYLSHYAPHFPIQAPRDTVNYFEKKRDTLCRPQPRLRYCNMSGFYPEYAAMIAHIDRGIGDLRALLKQEKLDSNTVIVLLSDNGGYAFAEDPDALHGQKSQLYEGGLRVPMVWWVPKGLAGKQVAEPVTGLDIYPTLAALAGADVSRLTLDGNSILPLLTGKGHFPQRDLFWYFPAYTVDSDVEDLPHQQTQGDNPFSQTPAAVIQRDGWKLLRYYDGSSPELYHLATDPHERQDLHAAEPARTAAMMKALENWLQQQGAPLVLPPNPAYRPAVPAGH